MPAKKFFRCTVCGDVHVGRMPPEICPTCGAKNAYIEVTKEEAMAIIEQVAG
ncbi:MAG: hypothetical protein QXH27_00135 [Candidatus Micrarchaeia archaeon]